MFLLPCIVQCSSLYATHHEEDSIYDEEDYITSSEVVEKNTQQHTSPSNCSRCSENRERREHRLQSIRIQILNQLGMREAPNITDKNLPHIPPLNHLLDRYSMQADAPHFVPGPEYGDEDDFYIAAEKVLAFAHTREYFLFLFKLCCISVTDTFQLTILIIKLAYKCEK